MVYPDIVDQLLLKESNLDTRSGWVVTKRNNQKGKTYP